MTPYAYQIAPLWRRIWTYLVDLSQAMDVTQTSIWVARPVVSEHEVPSQSAAIGKTAEAAG